MPSRSSDPTAFLTTRRTTLEPMTPGHASELFRILSDPRIYEFIPEDPPISEGALRSRIERWVIGPGPGTRELWFNWAIRLNRERNVAGTLQATIASDERRALIAYILGPEFWGQGIATEAVRRLLSWLSTRGDVSEIIALVDSRNAPSIRLVGRLGFELIGTEQNAGFFKGNRSDEHTFRLAVPPPPQASGE